MSTKEMVYSYIDNLNETQLTAVAELLKVFTMPAEAVPDEWDLEMIKRAKSENDGKTVSIENLSKELGIDYGSL